MSAGIDSMVLIWATKRSKGKPRAGADDMQRRARILIKDLTNKKEMIIAPTVAVAEFLCGIEEKDHGDVVAELQKSFFCPPFDLRASTIAAVLWQYHSSWPKGEQIKDRVHLRADVMIVATARAAGASTFYSHDSRCRKLASKAGMIALDLPTHSEQLFTELEIKEDDETETEQKKGDNKKKPKE